MTERSHAQVQPRRPAWRPTADRFTEFCNFVSLGGVSGGAVTTLAAPVFVDRVAEFSLALAAPLLFVPRLRLESRRSAAASPIVGAHSSDAIERSKCNGTMG